VPIPEFDISTGNLPVGDHEASWDEMSTVLGFTFRRRELLVDLHAVLRDLSIRGVRKVWIDGSFVTMKERPKDVDVVYLPPFGADPTTWGTLAPQNRAVLAKARRVDLWPYPSPQPRLGKPAITIRDFFAEDRDGIVKGLVTLDLGGLPNDQK
jgi:hypothetical protein